MVSTASSSSSSAASPGRSHSTTSTITVTRQPAANAVLGTADQVPSAAAVPEEPAVNPPEATKPGDSSEDRDSSVSRDSLRRRVVQRQQSLTLQEQSFLNDLLVHGNEIEVKLAFERLEDEELFFEDSLEHGSKPTEQRDEPFKARPTLDRGSSIGSQKRMEVLEHRKSGTHKQLWRAHQSGLALTTTGSRLSLLRRSSSLASTSTYGAQPPPLDIFRRMSPLVSSSSVSTSQRGSTGSLSSQGRESSYFSLPRPSGPSAYQRSRSLALSPPPVPPRASIGSRRYSSSSSRKSVTFHERTDGTPKPRPRTSKSLRRSSSDTAAFRDARRDSTSSIPSIRPGVPIRQDSVSSIPSLHHANPIRQDSVSSIPSLHQAHPIRQESFSSIPSLHQAHPIRQDSIASSLGNETIPGLQHAHALRSDSIRSIPSLHHGVPLREESMGSLSSILPDGSFVGLSLEDATEQDRRARLLQQSYSASEKVANAWLQQQQQQPQEPTTENLSTPLSPPKGTVAIDPGSLSPLTQFTPDASSAARKPVLMRLASKNAYDGEGIEVTDAAPPLLRDSTIKNNNAPPSQWAPAPFFPSVISTDASLLRPSNSFDTMQSYRHPEIFRGLQRSLSDEDMGQLFLGSSAANLLLRESSARDVSFYGMADDQLLGDDDDDEASWDMQSESGRFDSWNVLKDEYVNGYGGGGTLDFRILGTHAEDEAAQPHVLSPPLMESLRSFLPYTQSGENFYLRYSMVRDGASLPAFLKRARGVQHSVLAIETVDGEVFGAFTGQAWRKNWNYFGTGESFLWRMRRSRLDKTTGILEQAQLESEIDVFPCTGENRFVQLCTHDRVALGGGTPSAAAEKKSDDVGGLEDHHYGFGLAISSDLLTGTTSPCVTFGSPSLSKTHSDGSVFEIVNLELWTMTPCMTVEDAEKLQLGKLFLMRD